VALQFNNINARDLGSIAGKFLSFASYVLPRFIGPTHTSGAVESRQGRSA
jgi:hypothetical protein